MNKDGSIEGTSIPNVKDVVRMLTQAILAEERGRVRRNKDRNLGRYGHDLSEAKNTLTAIDDTLARISDIGDFGPALIDSHRALGKARAKGFEELQVTGPLKTTRDKLAEIARDLAEQAIKLDTVITHIERGETEE